MAKSERNKQTVAACALAETRLSLALTAIATEIGGLYPKADFRRALESAIGSASHYSQINELVRSTGATIVCADCGVGREYGCDCDVLQEVSRRGYGVVPGDGAGPWPADGLVRLTQCDDHGKLWCCSVGRTVREALDRDGAVGHSDDHGMLPPKWMTSGAA